MPGENDAATRPAGEQRMTGRVIAVRMDLVELTGSLNAGVMLSQLLYWTSRTANPHGWVFKSRTEWSAETGISCFQVDGAKRLLRKMGLIETKLKRAWGSPTLHYRANFDAIESALSHRHKAAADSQNSTSGRSTHGFPDDSKIHFSETVTFITETTPEITPEITPYISLSRNARAREEISRSYPDGDPSELTFPEDRTRYGDARIGIDAVTDGDEPEPYCATDPYFDILERTGQFPATRDDRRLREIIWDYPGIDHYLEFKKFAEFWSGREMGNPWLALRNWLDYARKPARPTRSSSSPAWHSRYQGAYRRRLPRVYTPPPVYDD